MVPLPPCWLWIDLMKTFHRSQFSIILSEIDYRHLILFLSWRLKIMHKKFQVNVTKFEGVTVFFCDFCHDNNFSVVITFTFLCWRPKAHRRVQRASSRAQRALLLIVYINIWQYLVFPLYKRVFFTRLAKKKSIE